MSKYLTSQGFNKIKEELKILKTRKRPEIAKRLKDSASFGDLSENSEYQEAKEAQAFIEGRILELETLLSEAVIIRSAGKKKMAGIGSKICVSSSFGRENFLIVGAEESSPLEGKISLESPLGKIFIDKKKGDIVKVETPEGLIEYKIIKIH